MPPPFRLRSQKTSLTTFDFKAEQLSLGILKKAIGSSGVNHGQQSDLFRPFAQGDRHGDSGRLGVLLSARAELKFQLSSKKRAARSASGDASAEPERRGVALRPSPRGRPDHGLPNDCLRAPPTAPDTHGYELATPPSRPLRTPVARDKHQSSPSLAGVPAKTTAR